MPAATVNQEVLRDQLVAIRTGMQTIFTEGVEDLSEGELLGRLAETVMSSGRSEDYEWLTDFMEVSEWLDERTYNDFKAYDYNIPNRDWEVTLEVKRNDLHDGRMGMYQRRIARMAAQFEHHRRRLLVERLEENGPCYDKQPYFSDAHPLHGTNKTQSNAGVAKLTGDETGMKALQAAITGMRRMQADNGKRIGIKPNLLVVPPALEWIGRELTQNAQLPDGSGNLIPNSVRGMLDLVVEDELNSDTAWYLFDTRHPVVKPFIYQVRQRVQFSGFDAVEGNLHLFTKKAYLFGADARYNIGYGLYQGAYRSTGAGS